MPRSRLDGGTHSFIRGSHTEKPGRAYSEVPNLDKKTYPLVGTTVNWSSRFTSMKGE
jgi:hypothetical protein